jgi:hypothetical protein
MLESMHAALQPWYLQIKFLHVFFAMIWAFSTAVAYAYYVKGAFLKWEREPDDPQVLARRNWAIEQFDKGAILEHVAFPVVMITGPLMYWLGPWSTDSIWLMVKLAIIALVFVPMEILDYWLAHFGRWRRTSRCTATSWRPMCCTSGPRRRRSAGCRRWSRARPWVPSP